MTFKPGDFVRESENVAVKINRIFVSEVNDLALLSFDLHDIEFDENVCAYKIGDSHGIDVDLIGNFNYTPLCCHHVAGETFLLKNI